MNSFEYTYPVLGTDVDSRYRVTPVALLKFYQDCVARFFSSRHIAAFDILDKDLCWIISEQNMKFVGPKVVWSDSISMEICIATISAAKVCISYCAKNQEGNAFAEGYGTWTVIRKSDKRPADVAGLMEDAGIEAEGSLKRLKVSYRTDNAAHITDYCHSVNISDLDINGHVNNTSYLVMAINTLSLKSIDGLEPEFFSIKYCKEAFLGDWLLCSTYESESEENQRISTADIVNQDNDTVCKVCCLWTESRITNISDISDIVTR